MITVEDYDVAITLRPYTPDVSACGALPTAGLAHALAQPHPLPRTVAENLAATQTGTTRARSTASNPDAHTYFRRVHEAGGELTDVLATDATIQALKQPLTDTYAQETITYSDRVNEAGGRVYDLDVIDHAITTLNA